MGETTGTTRRTSDLDLRGRRALVTGAASGIGRACARRLAAAGAEVTVLDRDADGAKRVAHELEGRVLVVDLAGPDLDTLRVDTDILVNNAGLQHVAPVQEFPPERFALLLRVMLEAPFRLARAALPGMYERGWGRIVNISSVHGLRASPFKSAYVAAKHGLEGLSKVIALEGGPQGVTSNCICPAYVRTPLVESQIADQARVHGISEDEVVATVMLTEPAIKRLVEPEEVAELAAFLCSEPASLVNDVYAHAAGDELLVQVSRRLVEVAGGRGVPARFGGDEFALLLSGLGEAGEADELAERLRVPMLEPFRLARATVSVGASVGVAAATPALTAGDLVRCADVAIYAAKGKGRNRVERFDSAHRGDIARLPLLEEHLAEAVDRDEIVLHYQPQIDLRSGTCAGVEALVRCNHPTMGALGPGTFIPLAERTGETACSATTSRAPLPPGRGRELAVAAQRAACGRQRRRAATGRPRFAEVVRAALRDGGLPGLAAGPRAATTQAPRSSGSARGCL